VTLGALVWGALHTDALAPLTGAERPYSVQLHLHGSFSESSGSHGSHTYEARQVGVDVLWWSDHDWRVTGYKHATTFGFDGFSEPIDLNEGWTASSALEASGTKQVAIRTSAGLASSNARISTTNPYAGSGCLELSATNTTSSFVPLEYDVTATKLRWVAPLATDPVITIAVDAKALGNDARAFLRLGLSEHADLSLPPGATYSLIYVLDNTTTSTSLVAGALTVPLAYTPGTWNTFTLRPMVDAVAGFAPFNGADNSILGLSLGVESRNGATAVARFDDLSSQRTFVGQAAAVEQARLLTDFGDEPVQLAGIEVSYHRHLNVYTPEPFPMPEYDALHAASGLADPSGWYPDDIAMSDAVARMVVDQVHTLGGIVSTNHIFGTTEVTTPAIETKEAIRDQLLSVDAFGVDMLEVGYRQRGRPLPDHLWVWDELAMAGIPLIGVGVTDSHTGTRGETQTKPNNFVSWIMATSSARADLYDGLARGRVWFGDPLLYDGAVELSTPTGFRMGQVVVSDQLDHALRIALDGLAAGDVVRLIRNGAEVASWTATGSALSVQQVTQLSPLADTHDRIEVTDVLGKEKVYSNFLSIVRAVPARGLDGRRAALDLGRLTSTSLDGVRLTLAQFVPDGAGGVLQLDGEARTGGRIELDVSRRGEPAAVRIYGFTGSWTLSGSLLTIDVNGAGSVEVVY
jgi:hypothetical protein